MRKPIRYFVSIAVVAFYTGVGGAAVSPYYGAVTDFVHNATAAIVKPRSTAPAGSSRGTPTGHTASDGLQKTLGSAPGSPTVPTTPAPGRPTPTPTALTAQQKRDQLVQRLAARAGLPHHRTNILILGSDNDAKNAPGATPPTQVIMVVSIDPISRTITLFNISRDSWVHIPGFGYNVGPDGTAGWNKIAIASQYGFDNTACAVEKDFGIPIDHWIWVGLQGFIKVIDVLNGVTVDVPRPVLDDEYPDDLNPDNPWAYRRIYIPPGPQHLNGDTALHFVRSRHGDLQSDFGRSQRQQIVITQLRHSLSNQDVASLVALAPSLLQALRGEVKTDIKPDLPTAASYWSLLRSAAHYTITQIVLTPPYSASFNPLDHSPAIMALNGGQPFAQSALQLNWNLIYPLVQNVFGGQDFSGSYCAS